MLGAFRVAHGTSIDAVDNTILQARTLMGELTKEMQERINRWKKIEYFCNFDIIRNPGYVQLEKILYGIGAANIQQQQQQQSPNSSTSNLAGSTMVHSPSYHTFPRNTSEGTLVDNIVGDNVSGGVDTISVGSSGYWPRISNYPNINYQSPIMSSTISPISEHLPNTMIIDELDLGLSMITGGSLIEDGCKLALYNNRM